MIWLRKKTNKLYPAETRNAILPIKKDCSGAIGRPIEIRRVPPRSISLPQFPAAISICGKLDMPDWQALGREKRPKAIIIVEDTSIKPQNGSELPFCSSISIIEVLCPAFHTVVRVESGRRSQESGRPLRTPSPYFPVTTRLASVPIKPSTRTVPGSTVSGAT